MTVKSTELQVGKKYHAFIEGGDIGGLVFFEDKEFNFSVLPKPSRVESVTTDIHGSSVEDVDLPEHLAQPNWYLIRKEGKQSTQWFNAEHVKITEKS